MSWSPDSFIFAVVITVFHSPCEDAQVSHAILQPWWTELKIGRSDAASWRTSTFCMSHIASSIFCQVFNLSKSTSE